MPKAAGVSRGLGEHAQAIAAIGGGALVVPLGVNTGRDGFGAAQSLSYDSNAAML